MLVLNLHNLELFYLILVYAVEERGFNFKTTCIAILYVELRCERAFSELYMVVSFIDITKFACKLLKFSDRFMLFSNEVKNCLRTRKKSWDLKLYCILLCDLFDWRYSIILDNFERFKFWSRITTKRFKLVKQNLKVARLNCWSDYQRLYFLQIHSKQSNHNFNLVDNCNCFCFVWAYIFTCAD